MSMNEFEEQLAIERIALSRYPEATGVREIQPFILTDEKVTGLVGSRSWISHPCGYLLKDWNPVYFEQITKMDGNGVFPEKFPM